MRILKTIKKSVLWLLVDDKEIIDRIKKLAEQQGVDPNRIIFANQMKHLDHLARIQIADLLLDTFPYGSHTTASDALWAGLPVVTLIGEAFASRVCASLLNAADLPEMITKNIHDYETLAIELALNKEKLDQIRKKLNKNKGSCALFDTQQYVEDLEEIYRKMHYRHSKGLPPDYIYPLINL
jgi:predicted O-linked N-acetylglucosamine transferase (SPINDLY family)